LHDRAGDLVSRRSRQGDRAETRAVVRIAVTDARPFDAHLHFVALDGRFIEFLLHERSVEGGQTNGA